MSACDIVQIAEKTIRVEWSYRSGQLADGFQAYAECLVCSKLILVKFSSPIALPVEPYIPVAEILRYEILYCPSCMGKVIIVIAGSNFFRQ
jgi:hypothetical protein